MGRLAIVRGRDFFFIFFFHFFFQLVIPMWRRPTLEEQSGGRWLVDQNIRIWIDELNRDPVELNLPDHLLEFGPDDVREENLKVSNWQIVSGPDVVKIFCRNWKGEYRGETKINQETLKIPHGEGHLKSDAEYTVKGRFFEGVPHGHCTIEYHRQGKTYEGEVKEGKIEGKGKLSYSDGTCEEGIFKNDKLVNGKFFWANRSEPKQYQTQRDNETPRDIARKFGINENQFFVTIHFM